MLYSLIITLTSLNGYHTSEVIDYNLGVLECQHLAEIAVEESERWFVEGLMKQTKNTPFNVESIEVECQFQHSVKYKIK